MNEKNKEGNNLVYRKEEEKENEKLDVCVY